MKKQTKKVSKSIKLNKLVKQPFHPNHTHIPLGLIIFLIVSGIIIWVLVSQMNSVVTTNDNVCAHSEDRLNTIIRKVSNDNSDFAQKYSQACQAAGRKLGFEVINKIPDQFKVYCGRQGAKMLDLMMQTLKRSIPVAAPLCTPELENLCPKPANDPTPETLESCQAQTNTSGYVRARYQMQLIRHWDKTGGKCFYAWECHPQGMGVPFQN